MNAIFTTATIIFIGVLITVSYVIVLYFPSRINDINLKGIGNVFFSASSIIGGLKLICVTYLLLNDNMIESDKVYTIYGGFCVVYLSASNLYKRLKRPLCKIEIV